MKCAIAAVGRPSGSPGKLRLRLPSSIGEQRWPASAAGRFSAGMMISRPWMLAGSSSRIRRTSVIWPSYSSPWLPAPRKTVGPLPFLITAIGMPIQP